MQMTQKWKSKQKGNAGIEKFGPLCSALNVDFMSNQSNQISVLSTEWTVSHNAVGWHVRWHTGIRSSYAWQGSYSERVNDDCKQFMLTRSQMVLACSRALRRIKHNYRDLFMFSYKEYTTDVTYPLSSVLAIWSFASMIVYKARALILDNEGILHLVVIVIHVSFGRSDKSLSSIIKLPCKLQKWQS